MNQRKKFLFLLILIASFRAGVFAEESASFTEEDLPAEKYENKRSDIQNFRHPEKITETPKNNAIIVQANVHAYVYLNGEYKGTTPIKLSGLLPGTYVLRVEKNGYLSQTRYVSVSRNTTYSHYFELTSINGYVELSGLPEGALIYADDELKSSSFFEISEGLHRIKVRAFGYKDFNQNFYIKRKHVKKVLISLSPDQLHLKEFYCSRKAFNPSYSNYFGSCTFHATVTAPGTGSLVITNEMGREVFSKEFEDFSTWSQKVTWDGKDSNGNELLQGKYTATFTAGEESKSVTVILDKSIACPLTEVSYGGSGIGVLSTPSILPQGKMRFDVSILPIEKCAEKKDDSDFFAPLSLSLVAAPFKHFETFFAYTAWLGLDETPDQWTGGLKYAGKTGKDATAPHFRYSASCRYGYSKDRFLEPYGADSGNGLGLGGAVGFGCESLSADISSEFIFGSKTSNPAGGDNSWKNGVAVSWKVLPEAAANFSCALISDSSIFDALQFSAGYTILMPETPFIVTTDVIGTVYFDSFMYIGAKIGLGFVL